MPFRKIKDIRENKRMSQEELAIASGVSRTIISGLETGSKQNATAKTLVKIAGALGVSVHDVYETEGNPIFFENTV